MRGSKKFHHRVTASILGLALFGTSVALAQDENDGDSGGRVAPAQIEKPVNTDMGDPDPISALDGRRSRTKSNPEFDEIEAEAKKAEAKAKAEEEAAAKAKADAAAKAAREKTAADEREAKAAAAAAAKAAKAQADAEAKAARDAAKAAAAAEIKAAAEARAAARAEAKAQAAEEARIRAEEKAAARAAAKAEAQEKARLRAEERAAAKEAARLKAEEAARQAKIKMGDLALIPPEKRRAAPLRRLPVSLPTYRFAGVNTPPLDFAQVGPRPALKVAPIYLTYFITPRGVDAVGSIQGTELGLQTASELQYVFVRVNSPGKSYLVVREMAPLIDKEGGVGEQSPIPVEVQGELELIEQVNPREGLWRAVVTRTLTQITVGSQLVEGRARMIDPSPTMTTTGPEFKIIGGQFENRKLVGEGQVVYLKGAGDSVSPGTTLQVKAVARLRNPEAPAVMNERTVGAVKVLETAGRYVTGYIVSAKEDIYVGDIVGGSPNASEPGLSLQGGGADLEFDEDGTGEGDRLSLPDPAVSKDDDADFDFE